ncbi:NUDIX domain-containing protein [Gordonia sp. Z-3]|jgi:8-oxo-dGTP pyrophosphatase MutT (NUDIX family)|uniref:NUDIX hydrolase n=1 Tax=unclassified Gordonia (in: high G+C Gram-positive bacteria) TaxID=2657482 RepID=UPI000C49C8C2|nr:MULTISPECIES: NUDIX domain-containing protein [unclassified Gordonia (in: high G+C Gram-positive bacteria)]MAU84118.1 NUDIX hydrolase [Gordonia sp. (in: high G+C Gram-positive bacteria)]MED5800795.1 NUDIX domain-containing protein [Gordonia sp. Z-3]
MSAPSLKASTEQALRSWAAPDAEQDSLRHTYLAFLAAAPDGCLRASEPGHITASAIVFDASLRHVLLTLHPRVGKWIQLGGHCEPDDTTIADAARREAIEESGIATLRLSPMPVHLHTHPITCSLGVPTRHLDVRYAAITEPTSDGDPPPVIRSDESVDLAWWPIDALPADTDTVDVPILIDRGLAAMR